MKNRRILWCIPVVLIIFLITVYIVRDKVNLPTTEKYCRAGDYSVTVQTNLKSGDYYSGEIIITNKSEKLMKNWGLYFKMYGEFLKLEDGVAIVNDYGYCLSGSSTSNTTIIPAGGSVHIPFRAISKIRGVFHTHLCCREEIPTEVTEGMKYQVYGENCSVAGSVTSVSENGYTLELTVTNTTEEPIENWGLVFATEDSIAEVIQSKQITTDCEVMLFTGEEPQTLAPGESVMVSYVAGMEADADIPTEFILSGLLEEFEHKEWKISSMEGVLRNIGAVSLAYVEKGSALRGKICTFNFTKTYGIEIQKVLNTEVEWSGSQYESLGKLDSDIRMDSCTSIAICFVSSGFTGRQGMLIDYGLGNGGNWEDICELPIEFYDHHDESEYTRAPDAWLYMENQIKLDTKEGYSIQRVDEIAASYGAIIVGNNQFGYCIELMEDVDYDTLWTISSQIDNEEGVDFALPVFLYPDDTYYGM